VAGAFEAVEWESEEALFRLFFESFRSLERVESEEHWKWVLLKGPRPDDTVDRLIREAKSAGS
jgi:hypothetical protein